MSASRADRHTSTVSAAAAYEAAVGGTCEYIEHRLFAPAIQPDEEDEGRDERIAEERQRIIASFDDIEDITSRFDADEFRVLTHAYMAAMAGDAIECGRLIQRVFAPQVQRLAELRGGAK